MDKSDPERDAVHEALQAHFSKFHPEGALLTGWVVVTEWIDNDGDRWIGSASAASTAPWTVKGMLHEVLYEEREGRCTCKDNPE